MISRREFFIRPLQAALFAQMYWQISLLPTYVQRLIQVHNANRLRTKDRTENSQVLAEGLMYHRLVISEPRQIVAHLIIVDRAETELQLRSHAIPGVTQEAVAQHTSTATRSSSASVAIGINANFFIPFRASLPGLQFPQEGDEVTLLGHTIVAGKELSSPEQGYPAFCVSPTGDVSLVEMECVSDTSNAVAGNNWLVANSSAVQHTSKPAPRTAIGISSDAIYVVVVDGRQPGYSGGMKLEELGAFLVSLGVETAINFDGGGSSTMTLKRGSEITILNSPIDHGIVGQEREVANQLFIEFQPK